MSLKEHFYLIKNKIFRKSNIVFIFAMIILSFILFSSLGVMEFFLSYKLGSEDKDISVRSLIVYADNNSENRELLKNIEHVKFVDSSVFSSTIITDVEELNTSFGNASIKISAIIDDKQLKVVSGKKQINNGEILCPVKFYPYYENSSEDIIVNREIIDGRSLIGKNITSATTKDFILKPEEQFYKIFNIVGAYDQSYNMSSLDTCYVTMDDFLEIAPLYSAGAVAYDSDGNIVDVELNKYDDLYLVIDNYKYMDFVKEKLDSLGFGYDIISGFDEKISRLFVVIPLFISLVIIIIVVNVIHNFNSKRVKQRTNYYGLLKAVGYNNKSIVNNQLLENVVCYMISFSISFALVFAGFVIIKKRLLAEIVFEGFVVSFPFIFLLGGLVIILFILFIVNKIELSRKLKLTIGELIRNDV